MTTNTSFFAYVISQKRRVTLRKKLQGSVSEVKRSPHSKIQLFLRTSKMAKKSRGRSCPRPFIYLTIYRTHCHVKHQWQQNTYYSNVLYHLYLYLILRLQLTPLLDNRVKMTSKRRSFILLIFTIYCICKTFYFQYKFTMVYCESVNLIGSFTVFYLLIDNSCE